MLQLSKELEFLDLCNFNTCNVAYMETMFNGCCKLKEIKGINPLVFLGQLPLHYNMETYFWKTLGQLKRLIILIF